MDENELDPFLQYLMSAYGGGSSGAYDYGPYNRSLGGMIDPTSPLEAPEIPTVSAASMGQPIQGAPQPPPQRPQVEDPYMRYLMGLGGY